MTPELAAMQERLTKAILRAEEFKARYQQQGSTMATCTRRISEIHAMLRDAGGILPDASAPDAVAARMAAEEETRYWLDAYTGAVPQMISAREALVEQTKLVEQIQAELRPHLVALEEQQGAQRRVANPPGAAPGITLGS